MSFLFDMNNGYSKEPGKPDPLEIFLSIDNR